MKNTANTNINISIQVDDFSVQAEYDAVRSSSNGEAGAIVSFVGLVRDVSKNSEGVSKLELSTYQSFAEQQCLEIAQQAKTRFPLQSIRIIHRYGCLDPDDQIVLVICSSKHRKAAFSATDFIMDFLKSKVAFWKKELSASDKAVWVEPSEDDISAVEKW